MDGLLGQSGGHGVVPADGLDRRGIEMKQLAVIVLDCVGLGSCLWGVFILSCGLVPDAAWRIIVGACLIVAGSMLAKIRF